jgi:hypothetical protein
MFGGLECPSEKCGGNHFHEKFERWRETAEKSWCLVTVISKLLMWYNTIIIETAELNKTYFTNKLKDRLTILFWAYSQTCKQRPPLGPTKSGRCSECGRCLQGARVNKVNFVLALVGWGSGRSLLTGGR